MWWQQKRDRRQTEGKPPGEDSEVSGVAFLVGKAVAEGVYGILCGIDNCVPAFTLPMGRVLKSDIQIALQLSSTA